MITILPVVGQRAWYRVRERDSEMADADQLLGMYLHLARASKVRQQPLVRAKLLVMAGVQAEEMGLGKIAALCRHHVLAQNPRHLMRRWPTIGDALDAEAFQTHLKQLRRRYSREKIEHMMQSLGIEMGQERAAYFTDAEYAAALLNTRLEAIDGILSELPIRLVRDVMASGPGFDANRHSTMPRHGLVIWAPFVGGLLFLVVLAILTWRIEM